MQTKQEIRNEVWNKLLKEDISSDPFGNIPAFVGQEKAAGLLRELEINNRSSQVRCKRKDSLLMF